MIDRRKFLERSVLSTGSVLFSSALLQSCTKYGIPLPGGIPHPGGNTPPPLTPPLLGSTIDWNDDAKTIVTTMIGMFPEAGELLSCLTELLWPSTQEDVWGQIKDQVEALVDQKIADAVYQQVSDALGKLEPIPSGLIGALTLYLNEVKDGNATNIVSQWGSTRTAFVTALPFFQSPGNELPLLPLFAQFANLYLGLLRDMVAFGEQSWGRTEADHSQDIKDLQAAITAFTQYTTDTYNTQKNKLLQSTPVNYHLCEPWRTINVLDRGMGLTVLDFWDTWPYFDVTLYSNGKSIIDGTPINITPREIYSDPYGSADDTGNPIVPTPPTQFPTNVTVWGGDRIDAVRLTYPDGSGPGGVTQTQRMGDQPDGNGNGGRNYSPAGGSFNLTPDNPIDKVRVSYGDIVNSMAFGWSDETWVPWMGGIAGVGGSDTSWISYSNRALSSIHINGESLSYQSADLILFGFMHWQSPAEAMRAIGFLYVRTPKEHSIADFAKAFPKLAIPANLITDDLKAARKAYWKKIKARAEAIK